MLTRHKEMDKTKGPCRRRGKQYWELICDKKGVMWSFLQADRKDQLKASVPYSKELILHLLGIRSSPK